MAYNEMRPPLLETGNGLGICSATTPCDPEHSATPLARQVVVSSSSIPSIDRLMIGPRHHLLWLARRARVSLAHASALAEAHGIGGL